jgi:DNA-directed RNA polymerase subunit K/omega
MEPKELEQLLAKVGGKYKLVTLYQKRMRELQRGMPRLVESASESSMWDIVSAEIMTSKVDLIMGEEADHMRKELALREAEDLAEAESKGKRERLEAPKPAAEAPANP